MMIDDKKTSTQQEENIEEEYSTILEMINEYYSSCSK